MRRAITIESHNEVMYSRGSLTKQHISFTNTLYNTTCCVCIDKTSMPRPRVDGPARGDTKACNDGIFLECVSKQNVALWDRGRSILERARNSSPRDKVSTQRFSYCMTS